MSGKLYAVELDYNGRRRVMPSRYETRAEARAHCDRVAPLFRAKVIVVRNEHGYRPAKPATAPAEAAT